MNVSAVAAAEALSGREAAAEDVGAQDEVRAGHRRGNHQAECGDVETAEMQERNHGEKYTGSAGRRAEEREPADSFACE